METTAFGALAALVASGLFSAGLVLQAGESRQVDEKFSLHLGLIRRLIKRPRWVEGTLLTFAGYPFHVLALVLAPLSIVQPALAAGLLLLLVIGARTAGETVRRRDWIGVGAIVIGIAVMALSAPERAEVEARTSELLIALAVMAVITLIPYAVERVRGECSPGLTTMATFAAGTAYAFSGITSKLVSDDLSDDRLASAFGWFVATAVIAGLGFLSQVTALQRRSATHVGPVIYVIPVLVPVLLAPFITGEDWADTPLGGLVLVVSLVVVSVGAGLVSSSTHVSSMESPTVTPIGAERHT